MSSADELRSRLPIVAAELAFASIIALRQIRTAARAAPVTEQGQAYREGVGDALKLLRDVEEAARQYERWVREVLAQQPDQCGLTPDELAEVVAIITRAA